MNEVDFILQDLVLMIISVKTIIKIFKLIPNMIKERNIVNINSDEKVNISINKRGVLNILKKSQHLFPNLVVINGKV